ncbi:MAG TPA: glycosyltransferase family 39 protein, partial [Candidatus Poseidoniales archaeon]|nr:glycosyltransferase family 39 protein [Candidatus Poseidoniales archaeon]
RGIISTKGINTCDRGPVVEQEDDLGWRLGFAISRRFWIGILAFGLILRVLGALFGTIGVDTHVHAAYASGLTEDGEINLDWGPLRNYWNASASRPDTDLSDIGSQQLVWHSWLGLWMSIFGASNMSLRFMGLFHSAIFLLVVWSLTRDRFGDSAALKVTAVSACHPILIMVGLMGYQEEVVATCVVTGLWGLLKAVEQRFEGRRPWAISISAVVGLIGAWVKGVDLFVVCGVGAVALIFFLLYDPEGRRMRVLGNPRQLLLYSSIGTILVLIVLGSFNILIQLSRFTIDPWRGLGSLVLSVVAFVGFWGVIAWLILPMLPEVYRRFKVDHVPMQVTYLMLVIIVPFWIIFLKNAELWVYETALLDQPLIQIPDGKNERPVGAGVNGRYQMILLVPIWWLILELRRHGVRPLKADGEQVSEVDLRYQPTWALIVGRSILVVYLICAMLPLWAYAQFHDVSQASHALGDELEDGEEFLLVTYPRQGTHRLYQMRLGVDPLGDREIMGHWRDDTTPWKDEIETCLVTYRAGDIHAVDAILIWERVESPEVENFVRVMSDDVPEGWTLLRRVSEPTCQTYVSL